MEKMMTDANTTSSASTALQAICLPHPNRSGELVLRMGRDKTGNHVLFEARKGCTCPSRWNFYRRATGKESDAFDGIDPEKLEAMHGPAGMKVYFHQSEL